jgi:diguanylate cyclase (GGDEF)-like protein
MTALKLRLSYNYYWLAALVAAFTALTLYMVVSLGQDIQKYALQPQVYHFEDLLNEQTIGTIDQVESKQWQKNSNQNFGLTKSSQWLKIDFAKTQNNQVLEIDYAMLDSVQLWFRSKSESSSGERYNIIQHYDLGDRLSFIQRPIIHDKFLVPLPDNAAGVQLLLRVQSDGPVKAPLRLWNKQDYIVYTASHRLFMGLFFGYMLAMGLINLFLFITTRSVMFITYAGYVFSFAMLIAAIHGLGYRFIWSESPWLQERITAVFAYTMMSFVLIFSSQILQLKTANPSYHLIFRGFSFIYILCILGSLIVPYAIMIKLLLVLLLFSIPVILLVSISLALKGSTIAKFFSAAWVVLLLSGLTAAADNFHWINLSVDSSYLLMVGATTETLLLALAVATSYSVQRLETKRAHKEAAQNELQAMQAQDEVIALQKQAQKDLEQEVKARTQEFENALAGLSKVHDELQGMSQTDMLTGLSNRRFFEENMMIEAARSRREKQTLAIALLDIDHFKKVNDTYGHQCGDDCLIAFANTLKTVIKRPGDLLSRYGGEEFVVLLPNTTVDGAKNVLEQFRLAIEDLVVETHGHRIQFTVSAGVTSRVITDEQDSEKMLAFADKLLYQAKEAGRNCVVSSKSVSGKQTSDRH